MSGTRGVITDRRGSASDNIKAKLPLCAGDLLSTTVTGSGGPDGGALKAQLMSEQLTGPPLDLEALLAV